MARIPLLLCAKPENGLCGPRVSLKRAPIRYHSDCVATYYEVVSHDNFVYSVEIKKAGQESYVSIFAEV